MKPNTSCISPVMLRQISFFRALSDDDLDRIVRHTREFSLPRGQVLFNRGDQAQGFHFVIEGQIKLAISSPAGNEKVVEVIHPMQTFGEAMMLLERPYPVFAQAVLDTRLLHIGQGIVSELIDRDPMFARKLLAGMAMRLHGLIQDVETYSLRSSTQRVIGYLLQSSGDENTEVPLEFDLPTSKQTIASRLNLTPETLSRIFADLSQAGLIHVHGKHVKLLDPKRLAGYEG
jgi:CRP/FNR family transcriptional regulator, dissimilatory nitrate respiration regulator